jgi:eukaryotic-like serine/threonine-protein kinase
VATGETNGADLVGRVLGGRYRVTAQLGRGGMGVVCRAVDEVLGREVAVKVLRAYSDASAPELADLRARMQREAQAAARIRHSGVITVHDVTEDGGRPVIVMELIDGPSLDDVLQERGALDPREAAAIGAEVMDALDAAHRAGVLHRDVKPGNVLLDRSRRVVLTDFGIASMETPGDEAAAKLTRSGEIVGSLDYLPPERALGQAPGPASDIWSLGMTLYAAVEGTSPFRRTSVYSTFTAIVEEPLPEPRRAGPLAPVLWALLAKDPAARPAAEQARGMLEAVAAGHPAPVLPPPAGASTVPFRVPTAPPPPGPAVPPVAMPAAVARSEAPTEARTAPGPARRRDRTPLVVAAAVAVVAVAAGAYALAGSGGSTNDAGSGGHSAVTTSAGASDETSASTSRVGVTSAGPSTPASSATGSSAAAPSGNSAAPGGGSGSGPASGGNPGGAPATTSPATNPTTGPAPAPSCTSIGGGKYNCTVWRDANSYTASGTQVGVVHAGVNYFYCQADLGRSETYGQWTNVWWAKTDDDSGNTGVYVSDVYLKGGANNQPIPGLPTC